MAEAPVENPSGSHLPREGMIDTAVRFLTNPNVVDRPFQQKQSFLKSKGMTDEEVRIACERANVRADITVPQPQQIAVTSMQGLPHYSVVPPQTSVWIRMRDILHTLALLGGISYAIFWVYKTYIEPFLFGRPKPKKSTEESLSSLEEAVSSVARSTNELRTEMRSELSRITQERDSGATRSLSDIKSDIATVKGLLLSRQQFPSAPTSASLRTGLNSKPSIPAWQMSAEQKNGLKDIEESNKDSSSLMPDEKSTLLDASSSKDSNVPNETDQESNDNEKCYSKSAVDSCVVNGDHEMAQSDC